MFGVFTMISLINHLCTAMTFWSNFHSAHLCTKFRASYCDHSLSGVSHSLSAHSLHTTSPNPTNQFQNDFKGRTLKKIFNVLNSMWNLSCCGIRKKGKCANLKKNLLVQKYWPNLKIFRHKFRLVTPYQDRSNNPICWKAWSPVCTAGFPYEYILKT